LGASFIASFVEVHCSPSFVNKRNFDARHLGRRPWPVGKSFNSAVLTSGIHHDYVDNRDVASPSGVLFGSRMTWERETLQMH
jgi:hypothetical protein